MKDLEAKRANLKEVQDKLANLQQQFDINMKKKAQLETDVDICTKKLERAEKLIGGLGGEKTRYTHAYVQLLGADTNMCSKLIYVRTYECIITTVDSTYNELAYKEFRFITNHL